MPSSRWFRQSTRAGSSSAIRCCAMRTAPRPRLSPGGLVVADGAAVLTACADSLGVRHRRASCRNRSDTLSLPMTLARPGTASSTRAACRRVATRAMDLLRPCARVLPGRFPLDPDARRGSCSCGAGPRRIRSILTRPAHSPPVVSVPPSPCASDPPVGSSAGCSSPVGCWAWGSSDSGVPSTFLVSPPFRCARGCG
jgi:hypothetical protein